MQYQLYSVYDEITNIYNLPYTSINENDAIRTIRMASEDPMSTLHKSPKDYTLYHIGIYDDSTGVYTNNAVPRLVLRISQLTINNQIQEN
ncbi:MAG: nonstructural protein [Microvirus sp.]|nr:MAG: nonstructural protein [Microvirus sp.]